MNANRKPLSIVWLRRDLRLHDHAALFHALAKPGHVQPVFVFDTEVLVRFANPADRRLSFIANALIDIDSQLKKRGGGLLVLHGKASEVMPKLQKALGATEIFAAEDYEPSARERDALVRPTLVKDQVIFDPREVVKEDGTPYKVFTPYSRAWLARLTPTSSAPYIIKDTGRYAEISDMRAQAQAAGLTVLDPGDGAKGMLADIGYQLAYLPLWAVPQASERVAAFVAAKIHYYKDKRDMVAEEGTSRLSPYLRFGLVSVRECLRAAQGMIGAEKWIAELIWREFYAMILYHYPESVRTEWNPAYRGTLAWKHEDELLSAWKEGMTGFPLVDAAMRELKTTGWMHNRARMVVASFLTKDLLLDWRLGEEHFAQLLMDYDQASNVGGWQWAASTGTDSQPWFRIFNPTLQSQKFDPAGKYIKRYVSELKDVPVEEIHAPSDLFRPKNYPAPIVDHSEMREKALAMFKAASS